MNAWRTKTDGPVLHVYFDDISAGWEQWVLLRSDTHHDAIGCDRELELRHLRKAKERGAIVIDGGDLFDAMQGRNDPRRSMDELKEEYKVNSYFDALVLDAAQFYSPFADLFVLFCEGNHELSVLRHNATSLTDRLVHMLRIEHNSNVAKGAFGGWVKFHFQINKTKRCSIDLKYNHHGGSGNAPVTRGVISTARQAVSYRADIVYNGHNHQNYYLVAKTEGLNDAGQQTMYTTHYIRTPGYNNAYGDGSRGYVVENGLGPQVLGASWLRFYREGRGDNNMSLDVLMDLE